MDVNGSGYHLVQGSRDWQPLLEQAAEDRLWWDEGWGGVSLRPRVMRFGRRAGENPPTLDDRRGAATDRYGNLFWIDRDKCRIRQLPQGTRDAGVWWATADLDQACDGETIKGAFSPAAPTRPATSLRLQGLAVTVHHYLVVGTLDPAGLLIFDLHAGGPPSSILWPAEVPFVPFDFAATRDGGVVILDRAAEGGAARLWRLDRHFRLVPHENGDTAELVAPSVGDFVPIVGAPAERPGCRFRLGLRLGLAAPVAVLALPDDSVLILESNPASPASVVYRFRGPRPVNAIELGAALLGELVEQPTLTGHDFAFVLDEMQVGVISGELSVVSADGNQAFSFRLTADGDRLSLHLLPRYLPLRRFSGKALVNTGTEVRYDIDDLWVTLTEQPRPRYAVEATIDRIIFDGRTPQCVWHRLMLDARIPPGDAIVVNARAADERDLLAETNWTLEPDLLAESGWNKEPAPYLRADGSELIAHEPFSAMERRRPGTGTWELLLQTARGRYLELCLLFRGNGRSTPRLRALRAWYPRFSYLEAYLPAVYREDPVSTDFLERFLANPEGLLTVLEGRIAAAERLFDTRTAPIEYLDWLAGWLGAVLDADWDEPRRRLFLAHAELLFRWRGTPAGLLAMIRVAIDPCPDARIFEPLANGRGLPAMGLAGNAVRIVEQFQARRFSGVSLGDPRRLDPSPALSDGDAYSPVQGPEPLHRRFAHFLRRHYQRSGEDEAVAVARLAEAWNVQFPVLEFAAVRFAPVLPTHEVQAADWRQFVATGIGFTYAPVGSADADAFRAFLANRYRRIDALNAAYALPENRQYRAFADIPLPDVLPEHRQRLGDWIGFVSLALPVRNAAHRFTVLVPTELGESIGARERRRARVAAVLEHERPAHTSFDVQLFWALFQVGGARLGLDTVLGEGSRYVALVLDAGYLGHGYLAPSHPWDVCDRTVIGRNAIRESLHP